MDHKNINPSVFFSSCFLIFLVTIGGAIWPEAVGKIFEQAQSWLNTHTSWIYVLTVGVILILCIWLMISKYGDIRLGPDHSSPEYKNLSWFAMLFSAGMGIGLLFFGVAEPLMHYSAPPVGEGQTLQAAKDAMQITFFHWGLHAWAIYAIFAVILAYYAYRKNLPLLPRSAFHPFIGDKIYGPIGHIIDTFAIFGTMFGVATSLGFGVSQVNAGLNYLFGIPQTPGVQVILIAIITSFATISVVLGLDGGIKRLSNINMILACLLLLIVLFMGETIKILESYIQNSGTYISEIVYKTFNLYAYERKESWIGGWTLLYWGWWISWSPFVGMFIARISKGRTIKEFMSGVLFIPTGFTFFWMTVFGNSALWISAENENANLLETVATNVPVTLFQFFEYFPASPVLSILGLLLVVTFFVSSSDSGSLVIDTLASGGAHEPPVWQRIFWAVTEGLVASVLLLAGGLDALQTMTIASAFPLIFFIAIACFGLVKSLRADHLLQTSVQHHNTSAQYAKATVTWEEHLKNLVATPQKTSAREFLSSVVRPALEGVKTEMLALGLEANIVEKENASICLHIDKGGVDDFVYEIRVRKYEAPGFAPEDVKTYYRAEVFLVSGGQQHDVYGYSQEQIMADVITHYEKHIHYLHTHTGELANG